jgi:hypothetical protein
MSLLLLEGDFVSTIICPRGPTAFLEHLDVRVDVPA